MELVVLLLFCVPLVLGQACSSFPVSASSSTICSGLGPSKRCSGEFLATVDVALLGGSCASFSQASVSVGGSTGVASSWSAQMLIGYSNFTSQLEIPMYVYESSPYVFLGCRCNGLSKVDHHCSTGYFDSCPEYGVVGIPYFSFNADIQQGEGNLSCYWGNCIWGCATLRVGVAHPSGIFGDVTRIFGVNVSINNNGSLTSTGGDFGYGSDTITIGPKDSAITVYYGGSFAAPNLDLSGLGGFVDNDGEYYFISGLDTVGLYSYSNPGAIQSVPGSANLLFDESGFSKYVNINWQSAGCDPNIGLGVSITTASLQDYFVPQNAIGSRVDLSSFSNPWFDWGGNVSNTGGSIYFADSTGVSGQFTFSFPFSDVAFDFDVISVAVLSANASGECSDGVIPGFVTVKNLSPSNGVFSLFIIYEDLPIFFTSHDINADAISSYAVSYPGYVANLTSEVCDKSLGSCVFVSFKCSVVPILPPSSDDVPGSDPHISFVKKHKTMLILIIVIVVLTLIGVCVVRCFWSCLCSKSPYSLV